MNASVPGRLCAVSLGVLLVSACAARGSSVEITEQGSPIRMARVERAAYGAMPDGREVHLFTLTNARGMRVGVTNYAGVITSIEVPDREGNLANVVLGFDSLEGYLGGAYVSSLIGRYGNRIAGGRFMIDGREHMLALNNGPHHLHGGPGGFHRKLWDATTFENAAGVGVELSYTSPDGEENYPGTLQTTVRYTLTETNELRLDYQATTDRATHVNLTHHVYFNLSADPDRDILDHEMVVHASRFTPVDSTLIPTGELASVEGTPLDFRNSSRIGDRIDADHPQTRYGRGYDHNWVVDGAPGILRPAARLTDPTTGRVLEVLTTKPGIQVYTGFRRRHAVALETQHFPNSPNQPNFPTTLVRPSSGYRSTTVFRFDVDR